MKNCFFISVILLFILLFGFCSVQSKYKAQWEGSYTLGKGLYMIEFDYGKIVVQGSYIRDGICYGGDYVVPLYEECYDSLGHVREYVINAIANEQIIIVKTILLNDNKYKYYLVIKTFDEKNITNTQIRNSFTYVFNSLNELTTFCLEKRIETLSIFMAVMLQRIMGTNF